MRDDTMASRKDVAVVVAECIAQWAEIESVLRVILSMLLETEARAGIAMYQR
jgi:hypothetical protein